MRWVSLCTALGAVLLPAVSAIPVRRPCNPYSAAAATSASVSAETTTSPISTLASTVTVTATTAATLSATETTLVTSIRTYESAPTTTTGSTTVTEVSTSTIGTPAVATLNGNFEGGDLSVWRTRTAKIVQDPDNALSGSWYAKYVVSETEGQGGNNINQTLNGLDTSMLFRLSFKGKLFEGAALDGANCYMEAVFSGDVRASWPIDTTKAGQYVSYTDDFSVPYKNTELSLRLRCDAGKTVSLIFGVDDLNFNVLPQSAATQTTTLAPAVSTSAAPEP